jgi:hypothetical protein
MGDVDGSGGDADTALAIRGGGGLGKGRPGEGKMNIVNGKPYNWLYTKYTGLICQLLLRVYG